MKTTLLKPFVSNDASFSVCRGRQTVAEIRNSGEKFDQEPESVRVKMADLAGR